jgi:hypothetical protein
MAVGVFSSVAEGSVRPASRGFQRTAILQTPSSTPVSLTTLYLTTLPFTTIHITTLHLTTFCLTTFYLTTSVTGT